METVVDKLIDFSGGQDEELRDISGLGMSDVSGSVDNLSDIILHSAQNDNCRITPRRQGCCDSLC